MDPDPFSLITFIVASVVYGVTVATEIAFVFVRFTKEHQSEEVEEASVQLVETLLENTSLLLVTFTSLKSLSVLAMAGMAVSMLPVNSSYLLHCGVIGSIWLLVTVVQVLIRSSVVPSTRTVALRMATTVRMATWLCWPLYAVLQRINNGISGEPLYLSRESSYIAGDRMYMLIESGGEENQIPDEEKQMISSILDLGETAVREVMIPRIDMVAFSMETTMQEALHIILENGHSRVPVYEENTDKIIGLLYAKDLLKCFRDQRTNVPIRELLRPVHFVPTSKKANVLLYELQKQRTHMAIVVDEYGGTAGLVTIEDLLEEIVGEIQDEYDFDEEVLIEPLGDQAYLLSARLDIHTLAELLETEIEEDSVDTLGGLVFVLSEHVPAQGEQLTYKQWLFTVLSVEGHRIVQIRAEPLPAPVVEQEDALTDPMITREKESTLRFSPE